MQRINHAGALLLVTLRSVHVHTQADVQNNGKAGLAHTQKTDKKARRAERQPCALGLCSFTRSYEICTFYRLLVLFTHLRSKAAFPLAFTHTSHETHVVQVPKYGVRVA